MENIITEYRLIETEDGYRIEIKGDKEKLKAFMKGHHGRGPRGWRNARRHRRGWGPWGFHPAMWMHMASCYDAWEEVDEAEPESE